LPKFKETRNPNEEKNSFYCKNRVFTRRKTKTIGFGIENAEKIHLQFLTTKNEKRIYNITNEVYNGS
jgi:hypothetical protein